MSVPTPRQAFAFLAPLRSRVSVFMAATRGRNAEVARFLLGCLAATRTHTAVFDSSSFYGSNIRMLAKSLPKEFLQRSTLIEPRQDQGLEDALTDLLGLKTGAIVIDDLNALHYVLSSERQRSGTPQLFSLLRMLSYQARINNTFVFVTAYRAEGDSMRERSARRSLSAAADLQIATDYHSNRIAFRCAQIRGWPNNRFSAPLYLEPST